MRSATVLVSDLSYPRDLGVGAQMLADYCRRRGVALADDGAHYDLALVSCSHPQDADRLHARRYTGPIVAGGFGALSPSYIGHQCTAVVLGDFRHWIDVWAKNGLDTALQLPNVWIDGQTRPVVIDHTFPWDMTNYRGEDGRVKVWVSRGCKRRCAFCQVGWACRYQENPDPDACVEICNKTLGLNLVTNDLGMVSFRDRLAHIAGASYSMQSIVGQLPAARTVRLGIEGVSERLRQAVGKPISQQILVDETVRLMNAGKCVRWFLIAGLPYETDDDWSDLREAVSIVAIYADSGVLQISQTSWVPEPATPLADMPMDDAYYDRMRAFGDWYFQTVRRGRIAIHRGQKPDNRRLKALAQLDCQPGGISPNNRVNFPYPNQTSAKKRYLDYML